MARKAHSEKWRRVKETIRKILGNNLVNGRFYAIGLGLNKDLRYGQRNMAKIS